jgi:hypothetical protein
LLILLMISKYYWKRKKTWVPVQLI